MLEFFYFVLGVKHKRLDIRKYHTLIEDVTGLRGCDKLHWSYPTEAILNFSPSESSNIK